MKCLFCGRRFDAAAGLPRIAQFCQECDNDRQLLATLEFKDNTPIQYSQYIINQEKRKPFDPEIGMLEQIMKLKHYVQQHEINRSYHAFFRRAAQQLVAALEADQTPEQLAAMDALLEAYDSTRYDPDNHRSDEELAPARALLAEYGLWTPIDISQPYSGINWQNRMHNELKPVRFTTRDEFEAVNTQIEQQEDSQ